MLNKESLLSLLKTNIVQLVFIKKDGTERKMVCSLQETYINPKQQMKPSNANLLIVWDLERDAFRSVRFDSLIDWTIVKDGYEL